MGALGRLLGGLGGVLGHLGGVLEASWAVLGVLEASWRRLFLLHAWTRSGLRPAAWGAQTVMGSANPGDTAASGGALTCCLRQVTPRPLTPPRPPRRASGQPDPRHGRRKGRWLRALGAILQTSFRTTQPRSASATAYGFHEEGTQQCTPSLLQRQHPDGCTLGACAGHRHTGGEPSRASLKSSRDFWGPSWALLGPTWGHLGPSWAILGPSWGRLGPS